MILLIHGYDLNEKNFICSSFFNGIYSNEIKVKFNQLEQSLNDGDDIYLPNQHTVTFYETTESHDMKFNVVGFLSNLKDYANSNGIDKFNTGKDLYSIFGLKVYDGIADFVKKYTLKKGIDIRHFHLLYEHKKVMNQRMNYFLKIRKNLSSQLLQANDLYKNATVLRNFALKISITEDYSYLDDLISKIISLKQQDEIFTELLISDLVKFT